MKDPKVGEKINVYHGKVYWGDEIVKVEHGLIYTKGEYTNCGPFHPNQCRRLIKKTLRTIWVEFCYKTNRPRAVADTYEEIEASWKESRQGMGTRYVREFVEVKKK
jgi:hypothetical protein